MRYLAVFSVERMHGTFTEEYVIEGNYNPIDPVERELIEDNTTLRNESEIVYAELVGLHGLND
jgi:hypothetical protein